MGAGHIIENNIRASTTSLWDKLPSVPDKSWLDFDLKDYNKAFVNLSVAVGAIVVVSSVIKITTKTACAVTKTKSVPNAEKLHDKYGYNSWAVIGDCEGNEDYAKFLAASNFNLVLMGSEKDVEITRDQCDIINK